MYIIIKSTKKVKYIYKIYLTWLGFDKCTSVYILTYKKINNFNLIHYSKSHLIYLFWVHIFIKDFDIDTHTLLQNYL